MELREAMQQDKEMILEYLKKDVVHCIYMYVDIVNYGIFTENMSVWIDEHNGQVDLVIMKYYDSYQIYTHKNKLDTAPILNIFNKYPAKMISARKDIIEQLAPVCKEYHASYGEIFDASHMKRKFFLDDAEKGNKIEVKEATVSDAREIAQLICSEEAFRSNYTEDNLAQQLAERIQTHTGRSCIIRMDGKIVAHHATYAEADGIAVVSGMVIQPQYRGEGCYDALVKYMGKRLAQEGKKAYTFAISKKTIRFHRAIYEKCGEYGKLVKNE